MSDQAYPILHLKQPKFPQFVFEFHPLTQTVYGLRPEYIKVNAFVIAENITDRGAAENAVLCWLRGYKQGKDEMTAKAP